MLPTKRLILGLRETAQGLKTNKLRYSWIESDKCNCGHLAIALGMQSMDVISVGAWTDAAKKGFCSVTNQPLTHLFKFLLECGLEKEDFHDIEHCGYTRLHVAQWMDQKADELEWQRTKELCIHEPITK